MKFKLRISLMFFVLCAMVSCQKEFKYGGESQNDTRIRSVGDGKLDLLGYGYDATMRYADATYGRGKIIDVEKIDALGEHRIEIGIFTDQDFDVKIGENSTAYVKKINQNFRIDFNGLLFSSHVKTKFSDEDSTTSEFSYASIDKLIRRKKLSIVMSTEQLRQKYLTPNFVSDCEVMSPEQIVSKYGTHVLTDIMLGGKLSLMYRSKAESERKEHTVEVGAKAAGFKVFGLGMSVDGNYNFDESEVSKNKIQSMTYQAVGGDPSINISGMVYLDSDNIPKIDLTSWQNSVTIQNSQLISIAEDGLIPIYDLVPGYKSNLVRDYILGSKNVGKRGLNYFNYGDLVVYNRFMGLNNDHVFLFMKFPDRFRIIAEFDGQYKNLDPNHYTGPINLEYFPDVKLYQDGTGVPYSTMVDGFNKLYNIYHQEERVNATLHYHNFLNSHLHEDDRTYVQQYKDDKIYYPKKTYQADLVKVKSTQKYHVRLRTRFLLNPQNQFEEQVVLYPINLKDLSRYRFSTIGVKEIETTGGAVIQSGF